MTVQDPLIKLEERLLALEFLTCPEQINPTDLVSIDNPKDSVIGGLLQTQKTLRKLGQEHRELGFFLDKYQELKVQESSQSEMQDISIMSSLVVSSFNELEFLVDQLKLIKELEGVVDKFGQFAALKEHMAQLTLLLKNSPSKLVYDNHALYVELLQDYYVHVQISRCC